MNNNTTLSFFLAIIASYLFIGFVTLGIAAPLHSEPAPDQGLVISVA